MKNKRTTISILYMFFALIFCLGVYLDNDMIRTVSKPLPLILLIFLIKPDSFYKKLIFIGFIFSLLGDIMLLKVLDYFILGLASFLVAHIFYILAFLKRNKKFEIISFLIAYSVATFLAYYFYPHSGDLLIPVTLYIYVIITMVWRAYIQRKYSKTAILAFVGAILFAVSDSNIAYTKFIRDYEYSKIVTIILYWTGQYLIAMSAFNLKRK